MMRNATVRIWICTQRRSVRVNEMNGAAEGRQGLRSDTSRSALEHAELGHGQPQYVRHARLTCISAVMLTTREAANPTVLRDRLTWNVHHKNHTWT